MPGSKDVLYEESDLAKNPVGTRNMDRMHRDSLPVGYPDDLARDSSPETGSIGVKDMPISNRKEPFNIKRGR